MNKCRGLTAIVPFAENNSIYKRNLVEDFADILLDYVWSRIRFNADPGLQAGCVKLAQGSDSFLDGRGSRLEVLSEVI